MTISLNSLSNSATNTAAGRQSTVIDNSSALAIDALVGGQLTGGAGAGSGDVVRIFAFGSYDGTSFGGGFGASDAAITLTLPALTLIRELASVYIETLTAVPWGPFPIAQFFGGVLPVKWGIFIVVYGAPLNSSGHELRYTPVKRTGT